MTEQDLPPVLNVDDQDVPRYIKTRDLQGERFHRH